MASLRNFRLPFSLQNLQKWVTPPVFAEDEKTRQAALVYVILLNVVSNALLVIIYSFISLPFKPRFIAITSTVGLLPIALAGFILVRRGRVRLVSLTLITIIWGMIAAFVYFQEGLKSPTVVAYYWVIVAAGLLLGDWGGPAFAALTIGFSFFLYNQQIHHQLPPDLTGLTPQGFLLAQVSTGFATGLILYITSRSIRNALNQARQSNRALTEALAKKEQAEAALHQLNLSLEEQVRQRTADLELANRELKLLHEQAEKTAVMEERHRLARELHDSTCQMLSGQVLIAEAGLQMIRQGDLQRSAEHLTRVRDVAHEVHRDMRLLLYELRPPLLGENGLMDVLRQRLEGVERRTGVEASLIVEGDKLPAPVEEAFYRVALEALNNAGKYAAATSVQVLIRTADERAELEVTDNGKGFDLEAASQRGGLGLLTMRERLEKLGGTLTIISAPGQGTQVKAILEIDGNVSLAG